MDIQVMTKENMIRHELFRSEQRLLSNFMLKYQRSLLSRTLTSSLNLNDVQKKIDELIKPTAAVPMFEQKRP